MVRDHIHPGNRCHVMACGRYDVLAAIPRESTDAVEENQVTLFLFRLRPIGLALGVLRLRATALGVLRLRGGADSNRKTDLAELFYEWTITIGNNHASYGLKQNSIL